MLNSNNSSNNSERSPELLVKDLETLLEFVNHPAWHELVTLVKEERRRAIDTFINLPVEGLATFLTREQLIGEARAYGTILAPITERVEELKQLVKETTQNGN